MTRENVIAAVDELIAEYNIIVAEYELQMNVVKASHDQILADLHAQIAAMQKRIDELTNTAPEQSVVWSGDYASGWESRFGVGSINYKENATLETDPAKGNVLKLRTPANMHDGFNAHCSLAKVGIPDAEERIFSYEIFFDPKFQWSNPSGGGHGKIPGLAGKVAGGADWAVGGGGKRWIGTRQALTYEDIFKVDGFSLRLLWKKDRGCQLYAYIPDPKRLGRIYGTEGTTGYRVHGWYPSFRTDPLDYTSPILKFNDGWNELKLRAKVNTNGQADGIVEGWLNGHRGLFFNNLILRTNPNVKVSQIWNVWHWGGPDSDMPTTTQYLKLANPKILL